MKNVVSTKSHELYIWLKELADAGGSTPTNSEIQQRLGLGRGTASEAIKYLEKAGKIRVTRYVDARRVEIVETGRVTGLTHKRDRNDRREMSPKSPETRVPMIGFAGGRPSHGCEWIESHVDPVIEIKHGRDPHCGARRVPGTPYCGEHLARSRTSAQQEVA